MIEKYFFRINYPNIINNLIKEFKLLNVCFISPESNKKVIISTFSKLITKDIIEQQILMGKKHFMSGLDLGFDIICAETILFLKNFYKAITLECVIPYKGIELNWSKENQQKFTEIIYHADKITYIHEKYTEDCIIERNKYMIDNSSLVIGLYEKNQSEALSYAIDLNKEIILIKNKKPSKPNFNNYPTS